MAVAISSGMRRANMIPTGIEGLAIDWVNMVQGVQVLAMQGAKYAGMGLAGMVAYAGWRR